VVGTDFSASIIRFARQWTGKWTRRRIAGLPIRSLVVFALSFGVIEFVEAHYRRYALKGIYFQGWSSEEMMQSVSLRELRAAPLESLWYLHVQPPVTNLIRAVIVAFHREADWIKVMLDVDRALNHAWALAGGALAALIDAWLRRLRVSGALAALLTLGWLLHPANLAFATLLDGTMLSSLLTTWILYETWKIGRTNVGSIGRLCAAVLLAYFTRSVYQWPFVLVMLASLVLMRVSPRRLLVFGLVVGLTVGLYSVKQAYLFGTVSTSTLQGTNLTRSIGANCKGMAPVAAVSRLRLTAPVLTERRKLDNTENFNHLDRLNIERGLMTCFRHGLAHRPAASLLASYSQNFNSFLGPSSRFAENRLVDRLSWREPVDWIFSGWRLELLALCACVLGVWQTRRPRARFALAMLLPVMYVFGISVLGESPDNMRFKFFLEPSLYVLVTGQICRALRSAIVARRALAIHWSQRPQAT
jgi:hypothetical protein